MRLVTLSLVFALSAAVAVPQLSAKPAKSNGHPVDEAQTLDLAKIESRPLQGSPWDYLFYLDFTGHADDPNCRRALEHLREFATILKVIGSYPKAARNKETL